MTSSTLLIHRSALGAVALLALPVSSAVFAATLAVGPGKTFTAPCAALTTAANGDTIEIDAAGS